MIEATQVKCPECGARLDITGDVTATKCSYCGTASRIERRSPVLELRQKLPPPKPHEPQRIARQVRSRKGKALFVLFMVVAIGLGPAIVLSVMYSQLTGAQWEGHHVIATDVDGDGVDDFIGFDRNVSRDKMWLAAYSGKTGNRLWRSPALGTYNEVYQDVISSNAAAGIALVADKLQHLTAFDAKTGEQRWSITAPEVVEHFCYNKTGDPPVVRTADKRVWIVRADGKLELATDCLTGPDAMTEVGMSGQILGMEFRDVFAQGAGPEIAFGFRSPGTKVPMIAALDNEGHSLWKFEIAGHDPLAMSTTGAAKAISERDVAIVYERKSDQFELTVFERATGKRRFEVPVKARVISTVLLVQDSVVVETWGSLQVFELATGTRRFVIGSP